MSNEEITVGRTVHYVVDQVSGEPECRPGVVVNTFTRPGEKSAHGSPGLCNMQVFTDMSNDREFAEAPHGHSAQLGGNPPAILLSGSNDYALAGYVSTVWRTSVSPQHAARVPGTWHWPRECESMVYPEKGHNHPPGLLDPTGCTGCRAPEDANVERGV